MLSRVSSHGALATASERLGAGAAGAVEFGASRLPSLAKCVRLKAGNARKGKILASAIGGSPISIKAPAEAERNYPLSFTVYHNVQEGDTLTSIARQYDTSLRAIALANKIEDIDMVQAGQVLLVPVHPRVFQKVTALAMQDSASTSESEIINTVVQPHTSVPAAPRAISGFSSFLRFTTPLLLLVPVIALCFRGMLIAAQNRIKLEVSRTQAEKEVWDAQHRPRLKRWQGILDGDRDTDVASPADAQIMETSEPETEEQKKKREEDELRKSYAELEATYMKFLADSGLSRSGYWRGGIPSSAHHHDG